MKKYKLKIIYNDKKIIIENLVNFRNIVMKQGRNYEPINEVLSLIMKK
jgi:hypothetical protein